MGLLEANKLRKKHEIMKDVNRINSYAGEYNTIYQGSTPELLPYLIEVLIDIRDFLETNK